MIPRYNNHSKDGLGLYQNIKVVEDSLKKICPIANIVIIADASLKYKVRDLDRLLDSQLQQKLNIVPSNTDADEFILKFALCNPKAAIISNDHFKNYNGIYNKVKQRRIPFLIIENQAFFYEALGE